MAYYLSAAAESFKSPTDIAMQTTSNRLPTIMLRPYLIPSTLRVLPCFTWPFVGVPFALTQLHVDNSPRLNPYCFASLVLHGLLALESLPSVAKGGRCTCALAYPPRHSRRAAPNPHFFVSEPSEHGVRGGIRSWSDWTSYIQNPIATGDEEQPNKT